MLVPVVGLLAACSPGSVHVTPPMPIGVAGEQCAALSASLPAKLDGRSSRPVTPMSSLTHAWGSPPVVMRCGVTKPAGYTATASLSVVNGVSWFQQAGAKQVTWTTVRPGANVSLAVPTSYSSQGGFLVDLAPAIRTALP